MAAYPGFRSMKRLGVFYSPLDGMLVNRKGVNSPVPNWVERGTTRENVLPKNTT